MININYRLELTLWSLDTNINTNSKLNAVIATLYMLNGAPSVKQKHHRNAAASLTLCLCACVRAYKKHLHRLLIFKNLSFIFNLSCHSSIQNLVAYFKLSYSACSYNQCSIQHMDSVMHRVHRSWHTWRKLAADWLRTTGYTGLFISPSGISELDCATTKIDTAERSISIGRESLQFFFY